MSLLPYMDNYIETNIDSIDKKGIRPELTFIFIGPPRLKLIEGDSLVNLASILNGFINQIDNVIDINLGAIQLIGAVNGISITINQSHIPIKPLGTKNYILESSDNINGTLSLSRLVVPQNLITKLKNRQSADNFTMDDLSQEIINKVLHPIINNTNSINYDIETLRRPFGILLLEFNKLYNTPVGANYFETCKVASMGKTISAGQAVILEGFNIQFSKVLKVLPK